MIACKDHAKNPIKGYFACPGCEVQMLRDEVERIKAENESLRKDAERYRWLREKQIPLDGHDFLSAQEVLDRRIDSAMTKEAK